jgi:hypothetical protein
MSLEGTPKPSKSHPTTNAAKPGRGGVQLAKILQALRGRRRHGLAVTVKEERRSAAAAAARDSKNEE